MSSIDKKKITVNTMMLYIRMLVIMLVTLYTSRVILDVLGVDDFGIYNVVAGVVAMFGFLNSSMSMATQRFFNFELGKNDLSALRKVFVTSVNIHLIVAFILLIFAETLGLWIVNNLLKIPDARMNAVNWVYQFAILSAILTIIQVPYNSMILAHEKMNIYAYFSLLEAILKLILVFVLSYVSYDKLIIYSFLLFFVSLLIFLMYYSYNRKKYAVTKYFLFWDVSLFKKIAGFSGWNILGQVGQMLTTQGVSVVANMFYGVLVNASIGITNQVNGAISMFVSNFQTSFRPQIIKSYASEEYSGMYKLVFQSSKFSFYLLYIVSVPIMFNIDLILNLWLNKVPVYSASFCKLLIWYSYLEAIGMPLVISIMASGKNKMYQIYVSIAISMNIVLSYLFLNQGFEPESIFYIKFLLSFVVLYIRLHFAKQQVLISMKDFFKAVIIPILLVVIITYPLQQFISTYYYTEFNVYYKLLFTICIEAIILILIYTVGLNKGERIFLNHLLVKLKHKLIK